MTAPATRAAQLGIDPPPGRGTAPFLVVLAVVLLAIGASLFATGTTRAIGNGVLLGIAAIAIASLMLLAVLRKALRPGPPVIAALGVIAAIGAAAFGYQAWGVAAAVAAAIAAGAGPLAIFAIAANARRQVARARAFEAELAAGVEPAALDAFVAAASRWGGNGMLTAVAVLYRQRRLTRALEVLRASKFNNRAVRADWLVNLHLELGDVAAARAVHDTIQGLTRTASEAFVVIDARIKIAEGDAKHVVDHLVADPKGADPRALPWRWAARADALVTVGDATKAKKLLDRIRDKDVAVLEHLATGGRPCSELAAQVSQGKGAPFR